MSYDASRQAAADADAQHVRSERWQRLERMAARGAERWRVRLGQLSPPPGVTSGRCRRQRTSLFAVSQRKGHRSASLGRPSQPTR